MASDIPVQNTGSEWLEHGDGVTCQSCHYDGTHRLPGAHDPAFVRQALSVELSVEDGQFNAQIAVSNVGHTVPTGDPFRRMELQICSTSSCGQPLSRSVIRRDFRGPKWHLERDSTLTPGVPREISGTVPASATWWRLYYQLAEDRLVTALPEEEVGYTVHEGPLPK